MQTFRVQLDKDAIDAVLAEAYYEGYLQEWIDENLGQDQFTVESVLEFISGTDLYEDVASAACSNGTDSMIRAFANNDMSGMVDTLSYCTAELFEALMASDDNDIINMLDLIVETRGQQ